MPLSSCDVSEASAMLLSVAEDIRRALHNAEMQFATELVEDTKKLAAQHWVTGTYAHSWHASVEADGILVESNVPYAAVIESRYGVLTASLASLESRFPDVVVGEIRRTL